MLGKFGLHHVDQMGTYANMTMRWRNREIQNTKLFRAEFVDDKSNHRFI